VRLGLVEPGGELLERILGHLDQGEQMSL
jgi:hypothetical protein